MTVTEQMKAVRREIDYRKRLYPKWVAEGRMTQQEANYQIEVMEQVLCTLNTVHNFVVGATTTDRKVLNGN